jgi:hypothetical protein
VEEQALQEAIVVGVLWVLETMLAVMAAVEVLEVLEAVAEVSVVKDTVQQHRLLVMEETHFLYLMLYLQDRLIFVVEAAVLVLKEELEVLLTTVADPEQEQAALTLITAATL